MGSAGCLLLAACLWACAAAPPPMIPPGGQEQEAISRQQPEVSGHQVQHTALLKSVQDLITNEEEKEKKEEDMLSQLIVAFLDKERLKGTPCVFPPIESYNESEKTWGFQEWLNVFCDEPIQNKFDSRFSLRVPMPFLCYGLFDTIKRACHVPNNVADMPSDASLFTTLPKDVDGLTAENFCSTILSLVTIKPDNDYNNFYQIVTNSSSCQLGCAPVNQLCTALIWGLDILQKEHKPANGNKQQAAPGAGDEADHEEPQDESSPIDISTPNAVEGNQQGLGETNLDSPLPRNEPESPISTKTGPASASAKVNQASTTALDAVNAAALSEGPNPQEATKNEEPSKAQPEVKPKKNEDVVSAASAGHEASDVGDGLKDQGSSHYAPEKEPVPPKSVPAQQEAPAEAEKPDTKPALNAVPKETGQTKGEESLTLANEDEENEMGKQTANVEVSNIEDYDDEYTEKLEQSPKEESRPMNQVPVEPVQSFQDAEDSHFFAYFLTMVIMCIIGYLLFHNKQKIIALVIEGRKVRNSRGKRPNSNNYRKLDNTLEEAVTSSCKGSPMNVIY